MPLVISGKATNSTDCKHYTQRNSRSEKWRCSVKPSCQLKWISENTRNDKVQNEKKIHSNVGMAPIDEKISRLR